MTASGMQLRASNTFAAALLRAVTGGKQRIRNRSFSLVAAVLRSACLTKNHRRRFDWIATTPRRQRRRGYEFAAQGFTHSIGSRIGRGFIDGDRLCAAGT